MIPARFGSSGGNALASYDYYDIDEGVGYVVYYGAKGTDEYLVVKNPIYSNVIVSEVRINDLAAATKKLDIDFDITFNLPKIVKGKAFVTFSQGANVFTSGKIQYIYEIVRIRKWDGATETEIANNQGDTIQTPAGTGAWMTTPKTKTECIEVDVPQTHFKKGETLRITMELWAQNDGVADGWAGFGHDPKDRDEDSTEMTHPLIANAYTTIMEIHIPFKLAL